MHLVDQLQYVHKWNEENRTVYNALYILLISYILCTTCVTGIPYDSKRIHPAHSKGCRHRQAY